MSNLFSVDTIFFRVLGYPMSYLEFVGTVLYLWSVWLMARRKMLTWPIGIISVILYLALFYQIRLYSDALEQIYYLWASLYGWWYWSRSRQEEQTIVAVSYSLRRAVIGWLIVTAIFASGLGWSMTRVHLWWPAIFPEAASYPYLDALTTVMSLIAMWLLARRKIESWLYWIVVDVIGIGLYFAKNIRFVALLYVILLGLAIRGLLSWRQAEASRVSASKDREGKSWPGISKSIT